MVDHNRLYITLNRESEWKRGLLYNLRIDGNALVVCDEPKRSNEISATAVLVTGSIDSTEHNFSWRNLLIDAQMQENAIIKVSVCTSETTVLSSGDKVLEMDSFLAARDIGENEKLKILEPLFKPIFSNCTDAPMNVNGRYIWIKLELILLEKQEFRLNKIKLLLKGEEMLDYLPEIYRAEDGENGFLSRFLSIFDSLFFEMDDAVEQLGKSLDYAVAKGKMLQYLAEWVCVDNPSYLTDEQLRKKISDAITDYRSIGVKRGLVRWIENEYGVTPNIIEFFNVRKMIYEGKDREVYKRLFGTNPYKFFIILPENVFSGTHESNLFMDKLKKNIPAYTEAEVIIAKKNIILENHTYLGVNSVIGGYVSANIDAGNQIAHDIILGGSINEEQ